jgi:hypothetical protein
MQITTLFFIAVLIAGCSFGMIAIAGSQTAPGSDTWGTAPSEQTSNMGDTVQDVQAMEAGTGSWFVLFVAIAAIVVIILGTMTALKRSGLGSGKYRTG